MGRGRSKAKQTKVARDLKYHSQDIDIERLAKELHGEAEKNANDDDFDPYAEGNYIPRRQKVIFRYHYAGIRQVNRLAR